MRQIGLLPAGCQVICRSLLFANEDKIYYSSTLSIYIYCARSFVLEKVVSVSERTVSGFSVVSYDYNLVATASHDGTLSLWRLDENTLKNRVHTQVQGRTNNIFWDPFSKTDCVFINSENSVRVMLWDTSKTSSSIQEIVLVKKQGLKCTTSSFNPQIPNKLALGCNNGWVMLLDTKERTEKTLQIKDRTAAVVDVQWDKLSSIYLVVAYSNFVSMWDSESLSEIMMFEKQHSVISAICWTDWAPGNFITSNERTGHLKVWNVSQKTALESIKVSSCGINCLYVSQATRSVIAGNIDGSISVFNLQRKHLEFSTSAGHTDTVFDCNFSPVTPELFATASYDGTVKIWNISTLALHKTLRGGDYIFYNCSWSRTGKLIAACSDSGVVFLWDVDSGREVAQCQIHTKASYGVAWSKLDESVFCSTSADCTVVVSSVNAEGLFGSSAAVTGNVRQTRKPTSPKPATSAAAPEGLIEVEMKFVHPAPVFGCAWCPHNPHLLVTGCQDSRVRVFNYTKVSSPLVFDLQGHSARSFNCVWSSLEKGLLASGSDDHTVIVWRIDATSATATGEDADASPSASSKSPGSITTVTLKYGKMMKAGLSDAVVRQRMTVDGVAQPVIESFLKEQMSSRGAVGGTLIVRPSHQLVGHKSNVRAVCFSYEHRQLLLSGSWDATIRLWDISTGTCLKTVGGHVADVYAVVSHPERPFTFISCSRDTTIRVWELEGVFTLLRATAVCDLGFNRIINDDSGVELLTSLGYRTLEARTSSAGAKETEVHTPSRHLLRPVLDGNRSKKLHVQLGRGSHVDKFAAAERFYKIFAYFCGANGSMDVWEAVLTLLNKRFGDIHGTGVADSFVRTSEQRLVFHENEVVSKAFTNATKSSQKRRSADRTDELVLQAAMMHAKCGNFETYCNMMVSINEWKAALAVAPRVSMDYWRSLSRQYADVLANQSSEHCVPYYLSVGRDSDAAAFYLRRRDVSNALVVAKTSQRKARSTRRNASASSAPKSESVYLESSSAADQDGDTFELEIGDDFDAADGQEAKAEANEAMAAENKLLTLMNVREAEAAEEKDGVDEVQASLLKTVYQFSANLNLKASRPILAAAQQITSNNVDAAISLLLQAGEVDLAYAVAYCFDKVTDRLTVALAEMFAGLDAISVGLDVLDSVQNREVEKALLVCKYVPKLKVVGSLESAYGPTARASWLRQASQEEAIGSDVDAVKFYVLSREFDKAVAIGFNSLRRAMREPLDMTANNRKILSYLKCVRPDELNESVRTSFYCHMLWLAAHEAAELQLFDLAASMLKIVRGLVGKCVFHLSIRDVSFHEFRIRVVAGDSSCLDMLADLNKKEPASAETQDSLATIRALLLEGASSFKRTDESSSEGVWGVNTALILRECQRLGLAMNLPSLMKLFVIIHSNPAAVNVSREGSLLPFGGDWNRQISCISKRSIATYPIELDAHLRLAASINEIMQWRRVLYFSPTLTGEMLNDLSDL